MVSAIDRVCQAVIDRRPAAGQLNRECIAHWFCSLTCAAAFASNPQWHVSVAKPEAMRPARPRAPLPESRP